MYYSLIKKITETILDLTDVKKTEIIDLVFKTYVVKAIVLILSNFGNNQANFVFSKLKVKKIIRYDKEH